jgi:hypothetical protein
MRTQMIQVSGAPSVRFTGRADPHAARHPARRSSRAVAIRRMVAFVFIVVATSGFVAMASLVSAGMVPPGGPAPALGM